MSCCGQKRAALKQPQGLTMADPGPTHILNASPPKEEGVRTFQYEGPSSLLVKGAITNKTYAFRFKGEALEIDARDVPAMMAEPDLQWVSNS